MGLENLNKNPQQNYSGQNQTSGQQQNGYPQQGQIYGQPQNGYPQQGQMYGQPQNGYPQQGQTYGQPQNGYPQQGQTYGQPQNGYPQQGQIYGQPQNGYPQQGQMYGQPQNGYPQQGQTYGQPQNGYSQQGQMYGQAQNGYLQPENHVQLAEYGNPDMIATPEVHETIVLEKTEETALAQPQSAEQALAIPTEYYSGLTPAEQQQLQTMAKSINITDKNAVMAYGAEQQASLSKFSDAMLKGTGSEAIGEAGVLLNQAMANLRSYDSDLNGKKGIMGFLKKKKNEIAAIKDRYTSTDKKLDTIVTALNSKNEEIKKISHEFDGMFEENKKQYLFLTKMIAAGEIALQNAQQYMVTLQNTPGTDPQDIRDFDDSIKRFDRRLYNLKLARALAISTAPQIRNVQSSADRVSESIQQAITISIPAWKTEMAIALGMRTVRAGLDIVNSVNDTTDALILAVSQEGKALSIESAKAQERGVIKIETLRTVNNNLIETFTVTTDIATAAVEERKQNALELRQMEKDLQTAIKKIK